MESELGVSYAVRALQPAPPGGRETSRAREGSKAGKILPVAGGFFFFFFLGWGVFSASVVELRTFQPPSAAVTVGRYRPGRRCPYGGPGQAAALPRHSKNATRPGPDLAFDVSPDTPLTPQGRGQGEDSSIPIVPEMVPTSQRADQGSISRPLSR